MRIILIGAVLIFLWFTAWLWVPLLAIGTGAALIGGAVAVHQATSAPQPETPEKTSERTRRQTDSRSNRCERERREASSRCRGSTAF